MSDESDKAQLRTARDTHRRAYDNLQLRAIRDGYEMTIERCVEIGVSLEAMRDSITDKTVRLAHENCDGYLQELDMMHIEAVAHLAENTAKLSPTPATEPPTVSTTPELVIGLEPDELVFTEMVVAPEQPSASAADVSVQNEPPVDETDAGAIGGKAADRSDARPNVRIDLTGVDMERLRSLQLCQPMVRLPKGMWMNDIEAQGAAEPPIHAHDASAARESVPKPNVCGQPGKSEANPMHGANANVIERSDPRRRKRRQSWASVAPPYCLSCIKFFERSKHELYHCPRFLRLDVDERQELVTEWYICALCFRYGHDEWECKRKHCPRCDFPHNSVLCHRAHKNARYEDK